jgi:hypothetical protein
VVADVKRNEIDSCGEKPAGPRLAVSKTHLESPDKCPNPPAGDLSPAGRFGHLSEL